jgi:hypothetical protein
MRLLFLLLVAGCNSSELSLDIRLPDDRRLLEAVSRVNLSASRNGTLLAQASFPATATTVSLASVSHGQNTVISLDGVDTSDLVIARGRTCQIDFESGGMVAPLYFAPTNFFAPTPGAPSVARQSAGAAPLSDGTVLLAGGADPSGNVLGTAESFSAGSGTFSALPVSLNTPRWKAQTLAIPMVGTLFTGGLDPTGAAIPGAEVYLESQDQFVAILPTLPALVGHRALVLEDGRVLLSGGSNSDGGMPLTTTWLLSVRSDGGYQINAGPPLKFPRREHTAVLTLTVSVLFGGYDINGAPRPEIEALDDEAGTTEWLGNLQTGRAEATGTLMPDGSILLAGGVDSTGKATNSAELFNPVTRMTTAYDMAIARRGHTATLLDAGVVLVSGGVDENGTVLDSVELFDPSRGGFFSERSLTEARDHHVAVPLCDGNVLIVGGAASAEVYTEPAP